MLNTPGNIVHHRTLGGAVVGNWTTNAKGYAIPITTIDGIHALTSETDLKIKAYHNDPIFTTGLQQGRDQAQPSPKEKVHGVKSGKLREVQVSPLW